MIDEFDLMPQEEPFDPFAVMLFKALQVLAFLFFIALLAIAPEAKDGKIDSKRIFIVAPHLNADGIKDKGAPTRVDFGLQQ